MMFTILSVLLAFVLLVYFFLTWNFDYWKKLGVNGPKPIPFLGNFPSVFTQKHHIAVDMKKIYDTYKHTDNFVGVFNCRCPKLMIIDKDLARRVLVTDFRHFRDNELSKFIDEKSDKLFGNNPFILTAELWKERRAEITPGFTINRIKTVFPVTKKVCKTVVDYIEQQIKLSNKDGVDAKELSLRYTCEVVSDCVLGLQANSFSKKTTPIYDNSKKLFDQSFVILAYMFLAGLFPALPKIKKLRFVPKHVETFFTNLVENSLRIREEQVEKGLNENRVDFMNYMLKLKQKKNLTVPDVTSHTMTFLLDGFETTAGVLAHCLLLLGRYPDKQEKLRQEILEKLDESTDFEALSDLEYLDACIHETLRLIAGVFSSSKICTEPIDLVNKDGRKVHIPVGTVVEIPVHAIMHDEDHYPNPNEFEPERFVDGGLKKCKDKGIFYGFGDGPRICLGMRFALTQIKGCLVEILRNYKIHINPKTRNDYKLDPKYFMTRLDGGIWLNFEKLN